MTPNFSTIEERRARRREYQRKWNAEKHTEQKLNIARSEKIGLALRPMKEVALMLGVTENAVLKAERRALTKLKKALAGFAAELGIQIKGA